MHTWGMETVEVHPAEYQPPIAWLVGKIPAKYRYRQKNIFDTVVKVWDISIFPWVLFLYLVTWQMASASPACIVLPSVVLLELKQIT